MAIMPYKLMGEAMSSQNFDYYRVDFLLKAPMLGTSTKTSIYHKHVTEKSRKMVEQANKLHGKVTKQLEKYQGTDFPESKEIKDLQAILRSYCQLTGEPLDIPEDVPNLLKEATRIEEIFAERIKKLETVDATVFMTDKNGHPIISTHMILGNLKENLKIITNNEDDKTKRILPSKTAIGETMALDVKFVEDYMTPNKGIMTAINQEDCDDKFMTGKGKFIVDTNKRVILERPISFMTASGKETAIAMSEALPEGTEFGCTLRVRKGSKLGQEQLEILFDHGKSNGFGAWRGSGGMGAYLYKLQPLPDFVEPKPEGWN